MAVLNVSLVRTRGTCRPNVSRYGVQPPLKLNELLPYRSAFSCIKAPYCLKHTPAYQCTEFVFNLRRAASIGNISL